MKLLTFLGAPRKYHETTYFWQDKEYTTEYAPAASSRFLNSDQVIVFLTRKAREKYYDDFSRTLPGNLTCSPVDIPVGRDADELWQLFELIGGAVDPGETVAFDITHGLRAFPFISLLVAAFLRSGLHVDLKAVLYGAYEVRDESTVPNRAPMFDLSPMIKLLEWSSAADRFNRTGDARYLASLVAEQRKALALAAGEDRDRLAEVGRLGNLAGALESISQSLRLVRPHRIMVQTEGLKERVEKARPALEQAEAARPFELLLDRVEAAYKPLGYSEPYQPGHMVETLEKERQILHWYVEREQWPQVVSLAREWLLSWTMKQMGMKELISFSDRKRMTQVLNSEAHEYLEAKKNDEEYQTLFIHQIEDTEKILSLWHTLTDTRNDIDHAGMRKEPSSPEDLVKRIRYCVDEIEGLTI